MKTTKLPIIAAAVLLAPSLAFASCGASFCSVNSNWTKDTALSEPGSSFDLRYEYIKQDQPRTGTTDIRPGQIRRHHDEMGSINRNLVASYHHTFASGWGLSVTLPFMERHHHHVHNHRGHQLPEQWKFTEPGDMRVTGRYELPLFENDESWAFLGLKLPTGRINVADTHGNVAERSLQPGTGTTDAIAGLAYHRVLPHSNSSWFTQVQYQFALSEHRGFKPGGHLGIDVGYRHGLGDKLGALLQLNAIVKGRDSGPQAESEDTGSRSLFLSPGLSYAMTDDLQVYGFYQHPLYQHVNGVQLAPTRTFVLGLTGRF